MNKHKSVTASDLQQGFDEIYKQFDNPLLASHIVARLSREADAAEFLLGTDIETRQMIFEEEDFVADTRLTHNIMRSIRENAESEKEPGILIWQIGLCTAPVSAIMLFLFFMSFSLQDILILNAGGFY